MRVAINLSLVKEQLRKFHDFKDLVKAIERYEAAQSVLKELREVLQTIAELDEISHSAQSRRSFARALTTHAIITYCRACHSKADARFNVGVTKRYSSDQKQKHKGVTDIRDKVIAHFGFPSDKNGKEWASECAVMIVAGDQKKSQFAFRRANYLGAVITDLEELVNVAIPTAEDIVIAADQEMDGAAEPHSADQRFREAVRSSPFHPELFFTDNPEMVESFWAGARHENEILRAPKVEDAR